MASARCRNGRWSGLYRTAEGAQRSAGTFDTEQEALRAAQVNESLASGFKPRVHAAAGNDVPAVKSAPAPRYVVPENALFRHVLRDRLRGLGETPEWLAAVLHVSPAGESMPFRRQMPELISYLRLGNQKARVWTAFTNQCWYRTGLPG
jgi:hypothetical protein